MNGLRSCFFYIILLLSLFTAAEGREKIQNSIVFNGSIHPIPAPILEQMLHSTWHPDCPVAIQDLAYLELDHWGFDHRIHTGALIVNRQLATEVVEIFKILFEHHFLIERMELIENFQGNDLLSMEANNTSAFNCRDVFGEPGVFSQHSYGRAIDINPLINPFVYGHEITPQQGAFYANRSQPSPGKIVKNDIVYRTFAQFGWDWAGEWYDVQDYQHFEKRENGEKRNPYG